MRGNSGTQRKALDYLPATWTLGKILSLYSARWESREILSAFSIVRFRPERWVSRRYLVFSSGIHSCLIRDAAAGSNPRIVLARLPAIVTKDILAWEKICWN